MNAEKKLYPQRAEELNAMIREHHTKGSIKKIPDNVDVNIEIKCKEYHAKEKTTEFRLKNKKGYSELLPKDTNYEQLLELYSITMELQGPSATYLGSYGNDAICKEFTISYFHCLCVFDHTIFYYDLEDIVGDGKTINDGSRPWSRRVTCICASHGVLKTKRFS